MRVLFVGILSSLLLTLIPPVHAEQKGAPLRHALTRVDKGTWTPADLSLIKRHPSIAANVGDPRQPVSSGSSSGTSAPLARQMTHGFTRSAVSKLGTCGHWYLAWFRKRSLLRVTMYKYYHRIDYCQTKRRITKFQRSADFWRKPDSIEYWRELVENRRTGRGTAVAQSTRMRHIESCIAKYGCFQNMYPWIRLTIRANGKNRYHGSAG